MENRAIKLIGKYALLLCILSGIQILTNHLVSQLIKDSMGTEFETYLLVASNLFPFLLNAITAVFVFSDSKKENLECKYSILLTVFYRPIGIVLFLLYVIDKEIKRKYITKTH
ncbi:hypothetical protein [Marinifilum fragile]|uniref:hypothetical protein n=1 Tax=Marinifilum fragile TaxID=570161 RepID=UPI002AA65862|nr:hypothetical protein [Marinifilum fragile]